MKPRKYNIKLTSFRKPKEEINKLILEHLSRTKKQKTPAKCGA